MRAILAAALVCACAFAAGGCRSGAKAPAPAPGADLAFDLRDYRVIWTRGGRLGYLQSFVASKERETPVTLHYVVDTEFRRVGWIANDGQGERFEYPADRVREAYRAPFERIVLPVDTLENQIRRIFEVDPATEIALLPADEVDVRRLPAQ